MEEGAGKRCSECFLHPHPDQSPKAPAVPVSGAVFDKKLKAVTQGEGNLSGHSFRRGGACWALSQNISGEIIKIMGDCKSTVYMSYLDQVPQPVLDYYGVVFSLALQCKPLLRELHWLPVKFRCQYKITTFSDRHIEGSLPPYLSSSLCTDEPSRCLWSSNEKLLKIPKRNLNSFGQRSFSFMAPSLWN